MVKLSGSEFLLRLGQMYTDSETKGSVWLTLKTHFDDLKGSTKMRRKSEVPEDAEPVCLVRATTGRRTISCHVSADEAPGFSRTLSQVMRLNVGGHLMKTHKRKRTKKTGGNTTGKPQPKLQNVLKE
eukprot:CAMPEP_0113848106 /NCGR_PEP_ID=MMETSP0372-20130328/2270_1 /TAXON_ID=340204 /ORGANISM="Lankesteria abbotti" /LENGTH=126 /DNA_ID=CAMNT_0000817507 /DNA_START=49 /DNA_END=429 /DNA_ORIENTATION=+ /assembly_acc=CAM_ASM_000359